MGSNYENLEIIPGQKSNFRSRRWVTKAKKRQNENKNEYEPTSESRQRMS